MKTWPADHPKAKLLKRKSEAILKAARRQFLANGYGGTSMEAIAADAGVSIMTLYRHAESKDELFEAVIAIACDPDEHEGEYDLSSMSLEEILVGTALAFQQKLTGHETTALLRAVIAEQGRFPELAGIAYRAVVGHLSEFVDSVLRQAKEAAGITPAALAELSATFVDALFGADSLRVLLGLECKSETEQQERAKGAARALLACMAALRN